MKLAIIGAGGHGSVVADIAEATEKYQEIFFFDEQWPKSLRLHDWPIIGTLETLFQSLNSYDRFIVAIGNNKKRLEIQEKLSHAGGQAATIIHPSAVVSKRSQIGKGTVVIAGAVINIGTRIGDACIINTAATVGHDCIIGDATHIAPGVSLGGGTKVGSRTWIGIKSCSRQLTNIGSDVFIGAGSVIVRDIPNNTTAYGNPAKIA